eukprot:215045_1
MSRNLRALIKPKDINHLSIVVGSYSMTSDFIWVLMSALIIIAYLLDNAGLLTAESQDILKVRQTVNGDDKQSPVIRVHAMIDQDSPNTVYRVTRNQAKRDSNEDKITKGYELVFEVIKEHPSRNDASKGENVRSGNANMHLNQITRPVNRTERSYSSTTSTEREFVRDIKQKLVYVVEIFEGEMKKAETSNGIEKNYELSDGHVIIVGSERFRFYEEIFKHSVHMKLFLGVMDKVVLHLPTNPFCAATINAELLNHSQLLSYPHFSCTSVHLCRLSKSPPFAMYFFIPSKSLHFANRTISGWGSSFT